jgi:ribosomal protein S27E
MFAKRIKFKKFRDLRLNMKIKCPECGSKKIAVSLGEVSCRKCGLVIDENMVVSY